MTEIVAIFLICFVHFDGILVPIKTPTLHEDCYICRNHYHAINIQAVCNHKFKLTNIVAK